MGAHPPKVFVTDRKAKPPYGWQMSPIAHKLHSNSILILYLPYIFIIIVVTIIVAWHQYFPSLNSLTNFMSYCLINFSCSSKLNIFILAFWWEVNEHHYIWFSGCKSQDCHIELAIKFYVKFWFNKLTFIRIADFWYFRLLFWIFKAL